MWWVVSYLNKKNKKMSKTLFIAVAASLLIAGCQSDTAKESQVKTEEYCIDSAFKNRLDFVSVSKEPVFDRIPLTGTVEVNPDNQVHFRSLVSGIVSETYFSLGDAVEKGQVLATLRSTELSSLQAQFQSLESQIRVAERKLESVRSMYQDGIASEREKIEAQSELAVLQSNYRQIQSDLELFNAGKSGQVFEIRAPKTGYIISKSIAAGSQISDDGDPLFTISDLKDVWVMANIYSANVRNIHEGMAVDIRTFSYPDKVFKGKISTVSRVYDQESRVLKAKIVLDNPELKLKPGMMADVLALKPKNQEAVAIPSDAIVFDDNSNYVIVYRDTCTVEVRKLDLISRSNGRAYVSEGLEPGETIVSKNQLLLYEQLKNFQE